MLAKTEENGRIAGALRFISPDRDADEAETARADGGREVATGEEGR